MTWDFSTLRFFAVDCVSLLHESAPDSESLDDIQRESSGVGTELCAEVDTAAAVGKLMDTAELVGTAELVDTELEDTGLDEKPPETDD